jgi:hypothetical protein
MKGILRRKKIFTYPKWGKNKTEVVKKSYKLKIISERGTKIKAAIKM